MFRLKLPPVSRIEGVTYSISTICSVHPQTTRPPHGREHMGQAGRMPGHGSGGPFGLKRLTVMRLAEGLAVLGHGGLGERE